MQVKVDSEWTSLFEQLADKGREPYGRKGVAGLGVCMGNMLAGLWDLK